MDYAAHIAAVWDRYAPAMGYGSVPAAVIVAQARLETGNFTSAIFRENRNAFGLKLPKVRPTLATGEARGHATFASVDDSVRDYMLRQRAFNIPNTSDAAQYISATVRSGYAEDPAYARKWAEMVVGAMRDVPPWFWVTMAGVLLLAMAVVPKPSQR